jgi:hypothetical protein
MSGTFAEIRQQDATPEIATMYADIKTVSGLLLVNLIWRRFATLIKTKSRNRIACHRGKISCTPRMGTTEVKSANFADARPTCRALQSSASQMGQSLGGTSPANRSAIQFTASIVLACAARPCPIFGRLIIFTLSPALQILVM